MSVYEIVDTTQNTKYVTIPMTVQGVFKDDRKVYKDQPIKTSMAKLVTFGIKPDKWKELRTKGGSIFGNVDVNGNKVSMYQLVFSKPREDGTQIIRYKVRGANHTYVDRDTKEKKTIQWYGGAWCYATKDYMAGIRNLKAGDFNSRLVLRMTTKIDGAKVGTHSLIFQKGNGTLFATLYQRSDKEPYNPKGNSGVKSETPKQEDDEFTW